MDTLEQYDQEHIVTAYVTRRMFEQAGLGEEGTEGLVESRRNIEGVDIAILFREEPGGDVKVSLRRRRRPS